VNSVCRAQSHLAQSASERQRLVGREPLSFCLGTGRAPANGVELSFLVRGERLTCELGDARLRARKAERVASRVREMTVGAPELHIQGCA